MRREFNRPLVIWPSLATATIIALMWITSPGNPFASQLSPPAADLTARMATTPWTPEGARDALRRLEDSLRRSWDDDTQTPWAGVEPKDRTEQGRRGIRMPERIAEAFGIDDGSDIQDTVADTIELPAPMFDEGRELAGMANPVARVPVFHLRVPGSDLLLPNWTIESRAPFYPGNQTQQESPGVVGEGDSHQLSVSESQFASNAPVDTGVVELKFPPQPESELANQPIINQVQRPVETSRMMIPKEDIPSILELFEVSKDGLAKSLQESTEKKTVASTSSAVSELATTLPSNEPEPEATSAIPESVRALGRLHSNPEASASTAQEQASTANEFDTRFAVGIPGGWPITVELDHQLAELVSLAGNREARFVSNASNLNLHVGDLEQSPDSAPVVAAWTEKVNASLRELRSLPRIGDPSAEVILDDLARLVQEGVRDAEQLSDRDAQVGWLRAVHGLNRRVAIWQPVWNIASGKMTESLSINSVTSADIQAAVADIRAEINGTGDDSGWSRFLMLDEIEAASKSIDSNERMVVAQRLLSRLHWHKLSDDQRAWMRRESIARMSEYVRPWASAAIDYSQLVSQLERQEADAVDMASINIADAVQTLRFSSSSEANRLSALINAYYRNANVRVAISSELLNLLLPEINPQTVPLRTQILGSDVRGYSNIASNLDLKLVPTKNRWSIELRTLGNVQTDSVGTKSGVAVRTAGTSSFAASTPISITPNRVTVNDTSVNVQSQNRLRGIRSDYDDWPLIGSLVRSVAESRFEEMRAQATRISDNKVRNQVGEEVDNRVDEQLSKTTSKFGQAVLGPLGKLRLDPMVIDMETTEERLIARYRLAGDWQLAAFTPRPRAPRTSLLSAQMHQSAINNTLEQIVPRDQPQTIAEVIREGAEMFGFSLAESTEDIPNDVMIQFAQQRPITVEIQDGQVWVTLRVVQLSRGEGLDLRRFIVRAAYIPQIDGMNASLVREGHLRISGPSLSMRERLPVRAIFNKVLSPNRSIPIVLPQLSDNPAAEGLAVSQLELRDGWLALAISKAENSRVALITPRVADSEPKSETDLR